MSGKNINFSDKKINKSSFYKNKKLFSLYDIDVNKVLVSKKESYCTKNSSKYFIGETLAMLNTLIVIRKIFLRLVIISY